MEGLVLQTTGNDYVVKAGGEIYRCHLKGSFKQEGIRTTNPVAVGDRVHFELPLGEEEWCWITEILPRKNYIIRRSSNLSKQGQIIGANLDRAFVVATVNYPVTSTTFVDRFLATCEAYDVPGGIILNKVDRYSRCEMKEAESLAALYRRIGYRTFLVSALDGSGLPELAEEVSAGITLLSGHSGVGKTSLINALVPGIGRKTQEISEANNSGVHTTTYSEMIPLPGASGAYLIDTPGVRGFGTLDFEREKAGHYFPDLFALSAGCRFHNCTHTHEPGCAVLRACEEGSLPLSRYKSYLNVLTEDDEEKYRAPY